MWQWVGFVGGNPYGMTQNQSKWKSKAPKSDDGKWSIGKNGFSYHGWLLWIKKIEKKI